MEIILAQGADYLLALKGHQKKAYRQVQGYCKQNAFDVLANMCAIVDAFDVMRGRVIPPFMEELFCRVTPPVLGLWQVLCRSLDRNDGHIWPLIVVSPEAICGFCLRLFNTFKAPLVQSFLPHCSVIAFHLGILSRLS